ncbi:hypothetical protein HOY81_24895, partial [Streptomyces sp. JJ36]|nr:hypothetical protein [Streptomyces sp. JJ36]
AAGPGAPAGGQAAVYGGAAGAPAGAYPGGPEDAAAANGQPAYAYTGEAAGPRVTVPVGPGRERPLGTAGGPGGGTGHAYAPSQEQLFLAPPATAEPDPAPEPAPPPPEEASEEPPAPRPEPAPEPDPYDEPVGIPDGIPREEMYFEAYRQFCAAQGSFPTARQLARALEESFGVTNAAGGPLSEAYLRTYMREFRDRYNTEMGMAG